MRDTYGDEIRVTVQSEETGVEDPTIGLSCHDSETSDLSRAVLSPKKARKLARKLLDAADEIDGGTPVGPPSSKKRVGDLERGWSRVLSRLDALEAAQVWNREQIVALLFDARPEAQDDRPGGTEPEPEDDGPRYLLRESWLSDRVRHLRTDRGDQVTFTLPLGSKLEDHVSTGFSEVDEDGLFASVVSSFEGRGWSPGGARTYARELVRIVRREIR